MEANADIGYNYNPSSSTIGIIYNNPEDDDRPHFLTCLHHTPFILPRDQGADGNITTICSTSDGLVAWYDSPSNIYYISNPLIPAGPHSFITLEESPMQHPLQNTHVVLATDFSDHRRPVYHVICAIQLDNEYIFDTYTSEIGHWIPRENMNLEGRDIVPNTGVSCARFAFWLTENPHSVLRFDIDINHQPLKFWPIPVEAEVLDMQHTRMQLGRINNQLGLVVLDASVPIVNLYLMQNNELCPYASLNLSISEAVDWDNVVFEEGTFPCREMPWPIRFQSSKIEVLLWVDGWLARWVQNSIEPQRKRVYFCAEEGLHIVNGFAHVGTWLLPGNFPMRIEDNGNQDDDHQDGGDQEMLDQFQSDHQDGDDEGINDQVIHDDDNGNQDDDHQDGDNQEIEDQFQSDDQDGDDQGIHDNDNGNQDNDHQDGDDQEMEDQFQSDDDQGIHNVGIDDDHQVQNNHQGGRDQGIEDQYQSDHQE